MVQGHRLLLCHCSHFWVFSYYFLHDYESHFLDSLALCMTLCLVIFNWMLDIVNYVTAGWIFIILCCILFKNFFLQGSYFCLV